MSEPTPVFDPPAIENGTSAVEAEGSAATTTTDNGGPKENNGQDVTMAGLEETGAKTAKTGADAACQDHLCYPTKRPPPHLVPAPTRPDDASPSSCAHHAKTNMKMATHNTTLTLSLARPSPMGSCSYRSPRNPGLVHLRAPSDFLAQLSLAGNNNNATTNTTTTTTASSSTNPPTPNRTSTPTGSKEGVPARLENSSSRAASAAPADRTADRVTMPTEPAAHGAPTRQYLNSKVTHHVMEGMKIVAKEQPADPLRVLGEFLLKRSADLERAAADGAAAAAATSATDGDKDKAKENGADTSVAEQ